MKRNTFFRSLLLIFFLAITSGLCNNVYSQAGQPVFYNIAGKEITELSGWSTKEDGTGTQPRSFSVNRATWHIIHNVNLLNKVSITGRDSKIIVRGDEQTPVRLTLLPGSEVNALVDVDAFGSLNILTENYPRFGIMHSGSTVTFGMDSRLIPSHDFYNLVLLQTTPVFENKPKIVVKIRGSLTLRGNVPFPIPDENDGYSFHFTGPDFQVIQTGDNVLRAHNLSFDKSSGLLRILHGSKISAENQIIVKMAEDAVFEDSSSHLYAGKGISLSGKGHNFKLDGTMVLGHTEEGVPADRMAGFPFIVTTTGIGLPNIIIKGDNQGGEYVFKNTAGDTLEFKGNLFIEAGAAGNIKFDNSKVIIRGDYSVSDEFNGTIAPFERIYEQ
jgi:hypothetical protein